MDAIEDGLEGKKTLLQKYYKKIKLKLQQILSVVF